jgi:diacylglycerol kinase (ATP)
VDGLAALLAALRSGRLEHCIVERPVLRVEMSGRPARYGMFMGVGMLHRAVDFTHRSFPDGRSQGVLGAGLVTGVLIGRAATGSLGGLLAPDKMRIARDGRVDPPGEILLALATTLERLFLRLRPFWGTEAAPIRITTIASGARGLARAALGVMRGRPPRHVRPETGYHSSNVHECLLELDAGLVLDGELFPPEADRRVRLTAPDRMRFVRA